jgi:hypothetical protein
VSTKKRVDVPMDDDGATMTDPALVEPASDTAFFPPPGKHERPVEPAAPTPPPASTAPSAPVPPFTDETARAPEPPRDL